MIQDATRYRSLYFANQRKKPHSRRRDLPGNFTALGMTQNVDALTLVECVEPVSKRTLATVLQG